MQLSRLLDCFSGVGQDELSSSTQKFLHTSISLIPLPTTSLAIRMSSLLLVGDVQSFLMPKVTCTFFHVYLTLHEIFMVLDTGHILNQPIQKVPINLLNSDTL